MRKVNDFRAKMFHLHPNRMQQNSYFSPRLLTLLLAKQIFAIIQPAPPILNRGYMGFSTKGISGVQFFIQGYLSNLSTIKHGVQSSILLLSVSGDSPRELSPFDEINSIQRFVHLSQLFSS